MWLTRGYRPFFLLGSSYAALLLLAWLAVLRGLAPAPHWLVPFWWHGHEMVFGFAAAAVAGFLLTAVPVWASREPVAGGPLAALVALWAAGRLAMLSAGGLPPALPLLVDGAFLPALAAAITPTILALGRRHNYGIPLLLLAMAVGNLGMHAQALGLDLGIEGGSALRGLRLGVLCLAVLLVIFGGRLTPIFTRSAARRAGVVPHLRTHALLDKAAVSSAAVLAAVFTLAPETPAAGGMALAAGGLSALRLAGWQSRLVWRDPLLWSLHLGYGWVTLGYLLLGASQLWGVPALTLGIHAITAGGFGTMILAVMSRVSLGHSGRPLRADRWSIAAYLLVQAGAIGRVLGTELAPQAPLALLTGAGLLWAAGYAVFALRYAPVLLGPRVDGRPA